jgi:hypothetical protein
VVSASAAASRYREARSEKRAAAAAKRLRGSAPQIGGSPLAAVARGSERSCFGSCSRFAPRRLRSGRSAAVAPTYGGGSCFSCRSSCSGRSSRGGRGFSWSATKRRCAGGLRPHFFPMLPPLVTRQQMNISPSNMCVWRRSFRMRATVVYQWLCYINVR